MSSSEPLFISIQGELGSFSHEAALAILPEAEIIPCRTALDVFSEMYTYTHTLAVIPIENSLAGSVLEFYDLLHQRAEPCKIKILREYQLRIRHNLIVKPGASDYFDVLKLAMYDETSDHLASRPLNFACSHPIALAQCRNFFERNRWIAPIEFYDTAGSVKWMMEQENPRNAAIASKKAAEIYGGEILREGIEDNAENYTRFLLLGFENGNNRNDLPEKRIPSVGAPDKMSLILTLKNQPGALVEALTVFSKLNMNLTKIESRPIQGRPWEYLFYVDVLFPKPEAADEAMTRLRPLCETILDLGRYKAAALANQPSLASTT